MIDRRNFMIGVAFGVPTLLVALTAGRGAEARLDQAEQFVRDLVDTAIDILKLPEAATAERKAGIERLLDTRFDLPTITKLVLGRYWRKATPDQKRGFATAFRIHIIKVYNSQLGLYDDQIVNTFDVVPYIAALNSVAPNPPYFARLDLNASGDINTFDLVPFIQLLNEACLP